MKLTSTPEVVYAPYVMANTNTQTIGNASVHYSDVPYYTLDTVTKEIKTNQEITESLMHEVQDLKDLKYELDRYSVYLGATAMASAKDKQIRMLRETYIRRFNDYYDMNLNKHIQSQCLGAIFALDILLKEDSTKLLHCGFATCD